MCVWGLSLPTCNCGWPWCLTQTSSIGARQHNLFWAAGWVRVQRDCPSAAGLIQPPVPASICPVEMHLKKHWILANMREMFCCWPSPLTLMRVYYIRSIKYHIMFNPCLSVSPSCNLIVTHKRVKTLLCLLICQPDTHDCTPGFSCSSKLMKWSFKTVRDLLTLKRCFLFTHNAATGGKAH